MGPDGRIRVMWLAKGLGQGGMERLLVTHARLGDRQAFDYRAAYQLDRPHSVIDELLAEDVPVSKLEQGAAFPLDVVRFVRQHRIDVVHVHSPATAAQVRPVLRVASPSTRIVYTEHNRWDRYTRVTRAANRATYRLNHRTIAVSEDCRSSISPSLRTAVRPLVHGVDVRAVAGHLGDRSAARSELGVDDDQLVVGTVANLRRQKNYPLLLEVAESVTRERPHVRFVAVGQGPMEDELRAVQRELGLGDRFRFLGFRADVHRVMSAFDLFCLSSDHEGLPVAVMEAKALGLPVVATDVGGLREAITDGVDGRLVPRGDRDALTRAVVDLATDPATRAAMGAASGDDALRFDAQRAVEELELIYADVVR